MVLMSSTLTEEEEALQRKFAKLKKKKKALLALKKQTSTSQTSQAGIKRSLSDQPAVDTATATEQAKMLVKTGAISAIKPGTKNSGFKRSRIQEGKRKDPDKSLTQSFQPFQRNASVDEEQSESSRRAQRKSLYESFVSSSDRLRESDREVEEREGAPDPESITIYPGNYTCYSSVGTGGRVVGNFTEGYCAQYSTMDKEQGKNQVVSLGDVYWICGNMRIRSRLVGKWEGECALAKAIMPLHILSVDDLQMAPAPRLTRRKRTVKPVPGSFDLHVYIDVIGVPRGVPDEFKARDQQRFLNYTRDALQGMANQLGPTSAMTFQNHMAMDMILTERGGVCKMLKGTGYCCTFILENTGPTGKVTKAIKQLEDLSKELKKNSGITDPWDQYFGWMSGWQRILTQIGIVVLVVMVLLAVIGCCILPCIKRVVEKTVETATPVMFSHVFGEIENS